MKANDHQLRFLQYNGVNKREKRCKKKSYDIAREFLIILIIIHDRNVQLLIIEQSGDVISTRHHSTSHVK